MYCLAVRISEVAERFALANENGPTNEMRMKHRSSTQACTAKCNFSYEFLAMRSARVIPSFRGNPPTRIATFTPTTASAQSSHAPHRISKQHTANTERQGQAGAAFTFKSDRGDDTMHQRISAVLNLHDHACTSTRAKGERGHGEWTRDTWHVRL